MRFFFVLFLLSFGNITGEQLVSQKTSSEKQKMRLNRVILATDSKPEYLACWPHAAKAWSKIVGVRPTLALVAHENVQVDESLGDVIRFIPVKGLRTDFQAQVIRLLLPALFPDEICIISDIDQIPANSNYFCNSISSFDDDSFVVFKEFISHKAPDEIPICYNAAKGRVFGDIFGVLPTLDSIRDRIIYYGETVYPVHKWYSDQKILFHSLTSWRFYTSKCIHLGEDWVHRKLFWYDWPQARAQLKSGWYHDVQLQKPFSTKLDFNEDVLGELGILDISCNLISD